MVELTVRAGDCHTGEVLGQRALRSGEQPPDRPPPLARGRAYCIEAVARRGLRDHRAGDVRKRRRADRALTDGAPIVRGSNADGRLALGASAGAGPFPPGAALPIPRAATTAREIDVGVRHTCLRLDDGSIARAGSNQLGQLGVPVAQPSYPEWQRHCPCVDCGI